MITWLTGEQTNAYGHLATTAVAAGLPRVQTPCCDDLSRGGQNHFAAGLCFAGMPAGLAILRREHRGRSAFIGLLSLVVTTHLLLLGLGRDLLPPSASKVDASPCRPLFQPGGLMEQIYASLQRGGQS
jgi:hypothetical protein